jgi:hypothetical protein
MMIGGDDAGDVVAWSRWGARRGGRAPRSRHSRCGDGALHIARAPVVGRHGQIPVAELVVERLHVLRVGDGGLLGVEALVEVAVALQAVGPGEGHELPHAAGAGARVERLRLKAGLGDGLVDQVLRDAVVAQHLLDHVLVLAGAFQRALERAAARALKGADETGDVLVDHERKVGGGGLELGGDLADQRRVGGEGDVVGGVQRGLFHLGREAVALLQGDPSPVS